MTSRKIAKDATSLDEIIIAMCAVPKCTGTPVKGSLCCAAHKGSEYDYGGQDTDITDAPGKAEA